MKYQSYKFKGTVLKTFSNIGTQQIMQCKITDPHIAPIRVGFANKPTLNNDESYIFLFMKYVTSERAFNALNISMMTNTDKDSVEGFYFPHEK